MNMCSIILLGIYNEFLPSGHFMERAGAATSHEFVHKLFSNKLTVFKLLSSSLFFMENPIESYGQE